MSTETLSNLSEFAATRDEAAFRRVVGEFGSLVLSSARRRTDDPQLAEEIAQNVFAIMARKAERLSRHRAIAGWVLTTTRLESAKALRGRQRHRRKLEALAAEINHGTDMSDEEFESWRDALPQLEAGLDRLKDADREALLARFFENKSFGQIATETGRSEAACKMRVHRSLEKLRGWMARRGVTLSVGVIASGLATEWVQAAPAIAIKSISTNAVAVAPTIGTGTVLTNTLMTMNAAKSASVAAATVLLVGAVPLTIQHSKANRLESEIAQHGEASRPEPVAKPTLSALKKPAGTLSPAQQMLRDAKLPDDTEELMDTLMDAVAEQDMGALMRAMVSLGRMSPEEIDELITRVSESEVHLGTKQAVRRMLIGFMDPDETDGAALLDRALTSDIQLFHTLEKRLARWAEKDPAGAAAWIEKHRGNPLLDASTSSNRIGDLVMEALLPGMARTDPELAISQLDDLDSKTMWTTIAAVAGSIMGHGGEGNIELARQVLLRLEEDRRIGGISVASQQPMDGAHRFDAFVELARSFEISPKRIASSACWMATSQTHLPARERADWLFEFMGDQDASPVRNFVWNTRQREADLGPWIAELPAGGFRDHALRGEISALVNNLHDGAEAVIRARMIGDDEMRQEALRFALGKFPAAADQAPAAANAREVEELAAALANPPSPTPLLVPAAQ